MKMTLSINSGVCTCGCKAEDHHLSMIMNPKAWAVIEKWSKENNRPYPPYVPGECTHYGFNEYGGMKFDEDTQEWVHHCHSYKDVDGPLAELDW